MRVLEMGFLNHADEENMFRSLQDVPKAVLWLVN